MCDLAAYWHTKLHAGLLYDLIPDPSHHVGALAVGQHANNICNERMVKEGLDKAYESIPQ